MKSKEQGIPMKDNIRRTYTRDLVVNCLVLQVGIIIIHGLFNGFNMRQMALIIVMTLLMYITFMLDLSYSQKLEKEENHPILRINSDRFAQNPHKELARYIEETLYYNNTWRISMTAASIICLILVFAVKDIEVSVIPVLFVVIFAVVYHVWQWKFHHSYNFIFKSVKLACRHLADKDPAKFKQVVHI